MLTPRTAVMSDALRRLHGSGIVTEAPLLEFDVGLVEDGDPECVEILGAAEVEPHALKTKPKGYNTYGKDDWASEQLAHSPEIGISATDL